MAKGRRQRFEKTTESLVNVSAVWDKTGSTFWAVFRTKPRCYNGTEAEHQPEGANSDVLEVQRFRPMFRP
jgi:hypothetical protein